MIILRHPSFFLHTRVFHIMSSCFLRTLILTSVILRLIKSTRHFPIFNYLPLSSIQVFHIMSSCFLHTLTHDTSVIGSLSLSRKHLRAISRRGSSRLRGPADVCCSAAQCLSATRSIGKGCSICLDVLGALKTLRIDYTDMLFVLTLHLLL